jgi:uncharacterized protein (DUF4415 family)
MDFKNIDIEKIAAAVEASEGGMHLDGLRESLGQAARGEFARVTTPEQIMARRGRPVGSVKAQPKSSTTIRFDQDVLEALKATGRGWQTRVNDAMRAHIASWQVGQPHSSLTVG